jgi:hypothetical protein
MVGRIIALITRPSGRNYNFFLANILSRNYKVAFIGLITQGLEIYLCKYNKVLISIYYIL